MLFYKLASKNKSIQGRNLSKLQLCVMRIVLKMKITDIAAYFYQTLIHTESQALNDVPIHK